jgi:DNA polymerase
MTEKIRKCQKCSLYLNQRPLLDSEKDCPVFWVGLSAKKTESDGEIPLSPTTNTGRLIQEIEEKCGGIRTYKTNLVKCLPLTEEQKLRYPSRNEIDSCFEHLVSEINALHPKIVFLLGKKVYSSVERNLHIWFDKWDGFDYRYTEYKGMFFVPVHHPSYIYVYKRKYIDQYIDSIQTIISELLEEENKYE